MFQSMSKNKKLVIGSTICLIICSCLLFSKTQTAKAVTVVVNPGESIQTAIDSLPVEGGIVELAAGIHDVSDTIYINQSNVTIHGTHDSEIRSLNSSNDVFRVNLERTTQLENITFDGFSVSSSYDDYAGQGKSIFMADKVDNLTIKNINDTSWIKWFVSANWRDTYYSTSDGLWILNNTLQRSGMTAVMSTNAEVAYNKLSGYFSRDYGMIFEAGNTGISIHDNYLDFAGSGANIQTESADAHIYNNICKGSKMGITARYNTNNILIEHNKITGATMAGIEFYSYAGLANQRARNNIIYDGPGQGIKIAEIGWATATGTSDVALLNNVIYNCGGDGIGRGDVIDSTWILDITNNIITNNTGYGINLAHGNITETHSYNNIWNNASNNYNSTSAGTGDISVNPLFASTTVGGEDFHLKSTAGRWSESGWVYTDTEDSSCIDIGDPTSIYSNESSPNGNRINMGAYGNTTEASKSFGGMLRLQTC